MVEHIINSNCTGQIDEKWGKTENFEIQGLW